MIGFKQAKAGFFDRSAVTNAADKKTRRVLSKFGAFVWRRSRSSIKKRNGASNPGDPPHSHLGTLRRFIFFSFEPRNKSVVIGPTKVRPGNAAEVLEFGGSGFVKNKRGTRRARFGPRPFMTPAFDAEQKQLPALWKG